MDIDIENVILKTPGKTLTAQNDFEIRNVCDLNFFDITNDYDSFHNHDFYEYFLVIEGNGFHLINGGREILFRNMLVALKPSDEHSFLLSIGDKMRILNLAFCKDIALPYINLYKESTPDFSACNQNQLQKNLGGTENSGKEFVPENFSFNKSLSEDQNIILSMYPAHIKISDSQSSEIVNQYHSLNIKNHLETSNLLLLKSFFSYLHSITILNSITDRGEDRTIPDWLKKSIVGLSEKDNCALGLSYLIDSTGMDQSYLCRIFRRFMNCTPTEYVNSVRLKKACALLTYTSKSVMDICFECGFASISHFNHLFKKCHKISPTYYRKRSN